MHQSSYGLLNLNIEASVDSHQQFCVTSESPQIPTATIDLDSSERHSSGDEKTKASPQLTRKEAAKITFRVDSIRMPPELVITSTQGNDLTVFERLYKSAQQSKDGLSDPEGKGRCQLHFRQQFWRVVSNGGMIWQGYTEDQDQLLKACSDKLTELKKRHKLKKMKYAENAALSVPKIFFANRRLRRKSRSFNLGRSLSIKGEQDLLSEAEETAKKKASNEKEQQKEDSTKKKGKSRKFRKGGIVSLATVHKGQQGASNNEENTENQTGKKKKKKKKLSQIHKKVKNAMQTVSMVALSSKKSEKNSSMKKRSSVT